MIKYNKTKHNKILLIIFVIILFIASWMLIIALLRTLLTVDLSLRPVYRQPTQASITSLHLVSYTDGPSVYFKNRNILTYSAINRGIDFFYNYRRSHIDPEFIQNNPILNEKTGAGFWLWKPYLILKALNNMPENDLLLYADSGLLIKKPIKEFIDANFSDPTKEIMLFAYDPKLYGLAGRCASRDTFEALGCLDDSCRFKPHVWAGMLVIKNTPNGRKFIQNWLDACRNADLLTGSNLKSPNYPESFCHQHDEAILSVLGGREASLVQYVPADRIFFDYICMHRRKSEAEDQSLLGFTNINLTRFERRLLDRKGIKQLRHLIEKLFTPIAE